MNLRAFKYRIFALSMMLVVMSCGKDFLEVEPQGTILESTFYQNEEEIFQGLIAVYDVLQWGATNSIWSMTLGLLNAASDDTYAGGSDASDQPNWVAYDNFTLNPDLGPQAGLWVKNYAGIYRANLILEKIELVEDLDPDFKARVIAECKFLRAYFYFELVRFFGRVPVITKVLSADEYSTQVQVGPEEVYPQIELDLQDAINTPQLPETPAPDQLGRATLGAARALLGKVILFQNNESRMLEAAGYFEDVISSGIYFLEPNFGDIFNYTNEFGPESVFEIPYSDNRPGDFGCCFASGPVSNATEGNFNVQFFGMRDYVGPTYASGWSFCPVTEELNELMANDPRRTHTIVDGNFLKQQGASYTEGYQNTDLFIRKYAPLAEAIATDGDPSLGWQNNIIEIRLADVYLMAAEALIRGGGDEAIARSYLNAVRSRSGLFPASGTGQELLDKVYLERRLELATEGHRFFDLVRTGRAGDVLGPQGYVEGTHQWLPIPQNEIDISEGVLTQNPGY